MATMRLEKCSSTRYIGLWDLILKFYLYLDNRPFTCSVLVLWLVICIVHSQGADVNAAPVPSSKDTALTIAADKGHYKFVELILRHGANVDVKNKKGNSPLWLAANGKPIELLELWLIENKKKFHNLQCLVTYTLIQCNCGQKL